MIFCPGRDKMNKQMAISSTHIFSLREILNSLLACSKFCFFISCFPQFFKIGSERLDFIEVLFENGCCRAIFGYVYPAT